MVASLLISMAALSTAIAKILNGCWRILTNRRMVEKATMESKTMGKRIKNWISKWCHEWLYILFGVTYQKDKQWQVIKVRLGAHKAKKIDEESWNESAVIPVPGRGWGGCSWAPRFLIPAPVSLPIPVTVTMARPVDNTVKSLYVLQIQKKSSHESRDIEKCFISKLLSSENRTHSQTKPFCHFETISKIV